MYTNSVGKVGRLTAAVPLAVVALGAGPTPVGAAGGPSLSVQPNPVSFGQTLVIKGKKWPVIEFCARKVRFSLRSAQNAFPIGRVRVSGSGRFTFNYKVKRSVVGAGNWEVRAKLPCESGKDGSPNPVIRSRPITIQ